MKKIILFAVLLLLAAPAAASAHATPVSYDPETSAVLESAPRNITIKFSEHVDADASTITVRDSSGAKVSGDASVDAGDTRILSVPLQKPGKGAYVVSWSVVSADDGHFTKGSYPFAVGEGAVVASASSNFEIVQITTLPEALGMTIELFGNGIIWAVLLIFAFAVRKMLADGAMSEYARTVRKYFSIFMWVGIVFAILGALEQIFVKSRDLAGLRAAPLLESVSMYLHTEAGSYTLYRLAAIACVGLIFFFGRRAIQKSRTFTLYDAALIALMCVFAFLRAKISHATANPFFPWFSVGVNFVHLIEKDFWAGATALAAAFSLSEHVRPFFARLLPRIFAMLAIDLAAVAATATYIVWLHLKSFDNLFATQWGNAFLQLLAAALVLVMVRVYHTVAAHRYQRMFSRAIRYTLAVEFALALLVVYYSSVVIITSPPLSKPHANVYSAQDHGARITLERDPYQDGMLLLTVAGGEKQSTPVVVIVSGEEDGVSVELTKQFVGGYTFPASFIPRADSTVDITVPQPGTYDAHASFQVRAGALDEVVDPPHGGRSFDAFTLAMIAIALLALAFAGMMYRYSGIDMPAASGSRRGAFPALGALSAFVGVMLGLSWLIAAAAGSPLANPYKAACESDGNMWHLMQPTRAGVPISKTPREGCMWGMGAYMYMLPDKREYDLYMAEPHADVSLAFARTPLVAGAPVQFTVRIKNADGEPATLFVDMEKRVHVVIVSKDERNFAHIHPDDSRRLTPEEISSSTFQFVHTFPVSGEYLISVDYAQGVRLESKQFLVHVEGAPAQHADTMMYPSPAKFAGYDVALTYSMARAGVITTFKYDITRDGKTVPLEQYLSAAAHISVVKNDFAEFLHIHGEVHPPGAPLPPIMIKNGQVVHSMALMALPASFTSPVEAHLVFPSAGLYTVWAEFKIDGKVVPTAFSVRVEE